MAKVNLSVKSIFTRITVLFIMLLPIEQTLVNAALADIAKAFPKEDPTTINLVSTLPTLISMAFVFFITPSLIKKFDKRSIIIFALIIYTVGGVMPAWLNSDISMLLIGRALLGVGVGLSAPMCGAIINELYSGMERENMIGWSNGVSSIIGMGMSLVAGALCVIHWSYTFYAYLIFIVVLLFEIFFLPKMPISVVQEASGEKKKLRYEYTSRQKKKLVGICGWTFICTMVGMVAMLKIAMVVVDLGLGDAFSAAQAMSAMMIGMFVVDLIYGVIERFVKRYILIFMPALVALGYFFIASSSSFTGLLVCSFIAGFGTGLSQPITMSRATAIGPRFNGGFAASILMGMMMLAQFAATYLEKLYGLFVDPTPLNIYRTSATIMAAVAVITLIYVVVNPFKGANEERVPGYVEPTTGPEAKA